jgi:hypothetical protein
MEGERHPPRKLELEPLIEILIEEHRVMNDGLVNAKEAAAKDDFATVRNELRKLDPIFRQHIADEESQILGLLIRELGVKGAAEDIKIFQQHRPIYQLMKKVSELASISDSELATKEAELDDLFDKHAKAEEERVFPRARSLSAKRGTD